MGKIDYNHTAMERAIHVAKQLKSSGTEYHGEGASYYDDIKNILKQIREYSPHNIKEIDQADESNRVLYKLETLSKRVGEIYNDVLQVVERINSTNNNISQQLETLTFGTAQSYDDFYNKQSLGWKIQDFGNRTLTTAKTLSEAAAIGVAQPLVSAGNGAVTIVGSLAGAVWFDLLGNDGKEEYFSRIEQHVNYWNKLSNPDETFYKNSAGRYDFKYTDSWIKPDDTAAHFTTGVFNVATNVGLAYVTGGGFKYFSAAQAGGNATSKALNEGYHLTDDGVMANIYLKAGKGFVEGKIYSNILGKIPQAKGLLGKVQNTGTSFGTGFVDNIIDSVIDKTTYKSDKDFWTVYDENGGLQGSLVNGSISGGFTALGEVGSGIFNRILMKKNTEAITINEIRKNNSDVKFETIGDMIDMLPEDRKGSCQEIIKFFVENGVDEKIDPISDIVKKNYPGMSDTEIMKYLGSIDSKQGVCSYSNASNMIFNEFKNNPELFEEHFGYPMYSATKSGNVVLNDDLLLADLHSFTNKDTVIKMVDGEYKYTGAKDYMYTPHTEDHFQLLEDFLSSKGIDVKTKNEVLFMNYALGEQVGTDVPAQDFSKYICSKIDDAIDNNKNVSITINPNMSKNGVNNMFDPQPDFKPDVINFVRNDGQVFSYDGTGHIVTVLGTDSDNNILVDNYGYICKVDPIELYNSAGSISTTTFE